MVSVLRPCHQHLVHAGMPGPPLSQESDDHVLLHASLEASLLQLSLVAALKRELEIVVRICRQL